MDKELILAALRKAGLSEDLADQVKAESDDELAAAIAELKGKQKPTLAELLKEAGLDEEFNKRILDSVTETLTSETDRRVTQALKTFEEKMSKGKGEGDDKTAIGELKELVSKLTEQVTGQQQSQEQARLKGITAARLEKAGLPKNWLGRVSVEKEDEIEAAVTALSTEMDLIKQGVVDETLKNSPFPGVPLGTPQGGGAFKEAVKGFVKDEKETEKVNVHKIDN